MNDIASERPSPTSPAVSPAGPNDATPNEASPNESAASDDDPLEVPPEPARECELVASIDDIYARVAEDVRDEGELVRYVSLGNRLSERVCPEDLESDRSALNKALNSLSTETRIVQPEAVDAERTLYRIDLRDLGWDEPTTVDGVDFDDKWEAIIAASPYALELEGDDADDAKLDAGTTVPVLYADALLDAALEGELYYALIGIGESEAELVAELAVDPTDAVLRAGTTASGMSQEDTVIARFDLGRAQGYYWVRRDVAGAGEGASVLADPLGFGGEGSAAIFSLPNGFQGYTLFDAAGQRQDESDVLFDRGGALENGVYCSGCHAAGINGIDDEVRQHVEANPFDFGAAFGDVLDEFPDQAEIDRLIRADNERYREALARAGLSANGEDPLIVAHERFEADVTLPVAAGFLGVSSAQLERDLDVLIADVSTELNVLRTGGLARDRFDELYLAITCRQQVTFANRPVTADCAAVD